MLPGLKLSTYMTKYLWKSKQSFRYQPSIGT